MDELALVSARLNWKPLLTILKNDPIMRKSEPLASIDPIQRRANVHIATKNHTAVFVCNANVAGNERRVAVAIAAGLGGAFLNSAA